MITIIGFSLIFFGSFSIIGIFAILISTILTNTPWWRKSLRKYQRRINGPNTTESGKIFNDSKVNMILIKIIEMLSITGCQTDCEQLTINKNPELGEVNQSSSVPLRFQPERLYGSITSSQEKVAAKATSMKHRKSVCSHLMPNIDSTTVMARRPSGSLFPQPISRLDGEINLIEQSSIFIHSPKERSESPLVKSSSDLNQPTEVTIKVDKLNSQSSNKNSNTNLHEMAKEPKINLTKVAERRASHASILGNPVDLLMTNNKTTESKSSQKKIEKNNKLAPKTKSRRSSLSCMVSPFQVSRKAELQSGLSNLTSMIDFQTSFLVDKEITDQKKVPPPPIRNPIDMPGGSMALSIDVEENLLKVRIARAVHLPVHVPWTQLSHVYLKMKLVKNNKIIIGEQTVTPTKNAIGCLEFGQHLSPIVVSFTLSSETKVTTEELLKNLSLNFEFYEESKKDSEEYLIASLMESVHSLISSHQTSHWNKGSVKKIFWHNLKADNHAKFLTGDALVSLSRNDREGSIWLSIPELRNLEFHSLHANFDKLITKNINVKLKLHVCILSNFKIIRSKSGFKMSLPLASFLSKHKSSNQRKGISDSKVEIKFNDNFNREQMSTNQEQISSDVHFNLSNVDEKIGSKMNYQIVVFLSAAFETSENEKVKAIGRIIIANQGIVMNNCVAENSQQIWKESAMHNGNRVYQWLSIE